MAILSAVVLKPYDRKSVKMLSDYMPPIMDLVTEELTFMSTMW